MGKTVKLLKYSSYVLILVAILGLVAAVVFPYLFTSYLAVFLVVPFFLGIALLSYAKREYPESFKKRNTLVISITIAILLVSTVGTIFCIWLLIS